MEAKKKNEMETDCEKKLFSKKRKGKSVIHKCIATYTKKTLWLIIFFYVPTADNHFMLVYLKTRAKLHFHDALM